MWVKNRNGAIWLVEIGNESGNPNSPPFLWNKIWQRFTVESSRRQWSQIATRRKEGSYWCTMVFETTTAPQLQYRLTHVHTHTHTYLHTIHVCTHRWCTSRNLDSAWRQATRLWPYIVGDTLLHWDRISNNGVWPSHWDVMVCCPARGMAWWRTVWCPYIYVDSVLLASQPLFALCSLWRGVLLHDGKPILNGVVTYIHRIYSVRTCMYLCVCIFVCVCVHIYIYRYIYICRGCASCFYKRCEVS